jgi:hypothetical protein
LSDPDYETPQIIDRTCETCEKNVVCEAYSAMKNCKEEFDNNFSYAKWPFNSEVLALHCGEYLKIKGKQNEKKQNTERKDNHCTV